MKTRGMLTARRGAILRIIVSDYIERASPVGSQHIAADHSLGVSPATIRNDMTALEEEGYIMHPHTSAGRIPSDKGYRYYVAGLLEEEGLSSVEVESIATRLRQWEGELEEWSRLAAEVLAGLAHTVAITTVPRASAARFKHLELVMLQEFLVLMVLVLQEAKIKQHLLRLDEPVSQDNLSTHAHRLSTLFEGMTASQIAQVATPDSSFDREVTVSAVRLMQSEDAQSAEQLHLEGMSHLLGQPEFASPDRLRTLMELLEGRRVFSSLLPRLVQEPGVNVVIGSENPAEELRELSLVIAPYGVLTEFSGTVGLLGPTRMHYARAISIVRNLSAVMTQSMAERYG